MRVPILLAVLAASCAHHAAAIPSRPLGVEGNLAEAERHEADADALERRAAQVEAQPGPHYSCGDQALVDQTTSGGQRLGIGAPCWSNEAGAVERDRAAARALRDDARTHRAKARALVVAQRGWCAGLPSAELDHTPFDHREDLAAVSAELDNDRVVGARIRFAKVPGLTADWLRQTLACHQAMAAAGGYEPTAMASCPAVIAGAELTVVDDPAGPIVVLHATDPAAALAIYGRAEALLDAHLDDPHAEHAH